MQQHEVVAVGAVALLPRRRAVALRAAAVDRAGRRRRVDPEDDDLPLLPPSGPLSGSNFLALDGKGDTLPACSRAEV